MVGLLTYCLILPSRFLQQWRRTSKAISEGELQMEFSICYLLFYYSLTYNLQLRGQFRFCTEFPFNPSKQWNHECVTIIQYNIKFTLRTYSRNVEKIHNALPERFLIEINIKSGIINIVFSEISLRNPL